jgi:hypothetical protein
MRKATVFCSIGIFWLVMLLLSSCSPASYPSTARTDNRESIECPNELPTSYLVTYDTIMSSAGDTLLFKRPYKPSRIEKVGFMISAAFIYWCIRNGDDDND